MQYSIRGIIKVKLPVIHEILHIDKNIDEWKIKPKRKYRGRIYLSKESNNRYPFL